MRKITLNELNCRIGECHPRAKLTDAEVELVHELREGGMSLRNIADKMGVGHACIFKIVSGRRRGQVAARVLVPLAAR